MRSGMLIGFAGTILGFILGCGSPHEVATVGTTPGAGGAGGSGGQDVAGGSGGQPAPPHIAPTWIKVLPNIDLFDMASDTTGNLLVIGQSLDTSFDGVPVPLGKMFVAKIDPQGNVAWLRSFVDKREVQAIAIGPDDSALVLGATLKTVYEGPITPDVGYERFYLTAFTADGELMWEQSFGGDFEKKIEFAAGYGDVAVDLQGNAIIAASFRGNLETPLGTFQTADSWEYDVAFVRVAPDSSILQVKLFDAPGNHFVGRVAIDTANQVIATASLGGSEVIVKLDESFSPIWTKGFSGNGTVHTMPVAIGKNDDVFVAGLFEGTVDFGDGPVKAQKQQAPFFARLDSAGNYKSSKTYPETHAEWRQSSPVALVARSSGEVTFSTQFSPSIDFGGGTISMEDVQNDAALAMFGADGTYLSGATVNGPGFQDNVALALSPQGQIYWAVSYLFGLKYGDQVLVEVPEPDSWANGSAIIALPP